MLVCTYARMDGCRCVCAYVSTYRVCGCSLGIAKRGGTPGRRSGSLGDTIPTVRCAQSSQPDRSESSAGVDPLHRGWAGPNGMGEL